MLWQKAKALRVRPSNLLGLEWDSYEAYCVDEAVVYFGLTLDSELEQAGEKPGKGEKKAQAARERILDKVLRPKGSGTTAGGGFADPASMFG